MTKKIILKQEDLEDFPPNYALIEDLEGPNTEECAKHNKPFNSSQDWDDSIML